RGQAEIEQPFAVLRVDADIRRLQMHAVPDTRHRGGRMIHPAQTATNGGAATVGGSAENHLSEITGTVHGGRAGISGNRQCVIEFTLEMEITVIVTGRDGPVGTAAGCPDIGAISYPGTGFAVGKEQIDRAGQGQLLGIISRGIGAAGQELVVQRFDIQLTLGVFYVIADIRQLGQPADDIRETETQIIIDILAVVIDSDKSIGPVIPDRQITTRIHADTLTGYPGTFSDPGTTVLLVQGKREPGTESGRGATVLDAFGLGATDGIVAHALVLYIRQHRNVSIGLDRRVFQ